MIIDGRTLTHEQSEYIRKAAVQRYKEGEKPSEIIKSYGLNSTTIYKWIQLANRQGMEALKSTKGTGRPPKLTDDQKQEIREMIVGKDPRQYMLEFGLWTRRIVQELIELKFEITLCIASVGSLLHELNLTPQKPLRRAYERDPEKVTEWENTKYPDLKKRAKKNGADIFFLDETGIKSDPALGRTWGEKGKTPLVSTSGQRQSVNAISAINEKGAFWYSVYNGTMNASRFVEFLCDFMKYRRRPVYLVVDGHPAHRAKMVSNLIQSLEGWLELHFLPPYCPELNPDEFVWNYLKSNGVSKKPLKQNESLKERVHVDLELIKSDKKLIRSFFNADSVAYINN